MFDISRLSDIHRPLLMLLGACLLALVVFVALPPGPNILHVLQKLGHPVVFALIALIAVLLQYRPRDIAYRKPWIQYLMAAVVTVLLGGATEIAQSFTHRDPSILDVWLDAQGAGCALALCAGMDRRCCPAHWAIARRGFLLIGVVAALIILTPLIWACLCYADRGLRFPTIADPASPFSRYFLSVSDPPLRSAALPEAWARVPQEMALRVRLIRLPYAGVTIEEPSPDWSGYSTLAVEVVNPDSSVLELNIRVNDGLHDQSYSDRFNAQWLVPARTRTVLEIPTAEIRAAPRSRMMDMRHITKIGIFRSGEARPGALLLGRVWLH